MKAIVKTKVGLVDYEFNVEERSDIDTLHKVIVLGNPRLKCNVCEDYGAQTKRLDTNKDKEGNTYINTVCLKCGSKSKLGQYKTGGYFWHAYEKWENKDGKSQSSKVADEIPFN